MSDENFMPYVFSAMQSIMENASAKNKYQFFILQQKGGILLNTKKLLKKNLRNFPQFSLEFVDVTKYIHNYKFQCGTWAVETMFKLLIPYLFPQYAKIIVLDADIICRVDIAELYQIELGRHVLAGVRDLAIIDAYHKQQWPKKDTVIAKLARPDDYFNAGVLVFNARTFRKSITLNVLLDLAVAHKWQHNEQDIFNYLYNKKALMLPLDWNFQVNNVIYSRRLPGPLKAVYVRAQKNPKILHFTLKPHNSYNVSSAWYAVFWKYAAQTPFYGELLERKKRTLAETPPLKRFLRRAKNILKNWTALQ
jgi:lipopolysaccharide biosynthesis glycosyltransferase